MKKSNFSFWLVIGISIGTAFGVAVDNIPAGVSMGAGSAMLILLLTVFEKDENK